MSPLTPHEFVIKWRDDTRKERSVSQEHFIDLCRLIGHETPGDNRNGTLVFEAGVGKSGGGQGWADVWKRGVFGWEYKGPRADLGKAYQQLQQYRDSLENPPLLVVSDIQTIVVHTNFVNTVKQVTTLTLDDLLTPAGLQTLRDIFTHPEALRPAITIQQVTEQAAGDFADLADLLRKYKEEPQASAHFLIRLLFCLFAEDSGLLPTGLFTKIITATRHKAPAFADQVTTLFGAMATGGFFGTDDIKHFNGGLFDNDTALPLDSDGMAILERVSALDWSSVVGPFDISPEQAAQMLLQQNTRGVSNQDVIFPLSNAVDITGKPRRAFIISNAKARRGKDAEVFIFSSLCDSAALRLCVKTFRSARCWKMAA